uniref:Ig-like domain-containing protein n=1 Tax=Plectus sambesii TaxID=2011161 RepID=A0A914WB64_9BILA
MRGISPCWLLLLRLLFVARVATANDDAARLVVRPESATVQLESRVSFFCRADGNPLPSISWRRNGHVISEAR